MAVALQFQVAVAQHLPTNMLTCHVKDGAAFLPVHEEPVGPSAVLGAACLHIDSTLAGFVALQQQPAYLTHDAYAHTAAAGRPMDADTQLRQATSTSGRKRAADCDLLHPAPSKQRCGSPVGLVPQCPAYATCHATSQQHTTPQWASASPAHTMPAPADCSSTSCPTAARQPPPAAPPLQYPAELQAWSASPHNLALLQHPRARYPTPTQSRLAPHPGPQYSWVPAAPTPHQHHCTTTDGSLSQHTHLRLTPAQESTLTTTTTCWAVPSSGPPQASFWGPSPPPQQSLWHPSPSSSTCSASSSWLPSAPPAGPLPPHHLHQYQYQQPHPHHPQPHHQHHPHRHPQQPPHHPHPHPHAAPHTTTIICHLAPAAAAPQVTHLAPLPQLAPCHTAATLAMPPQAASQAPPLPPSVAWYSDTNSPAALLEANDFMAGITLPGAVEYLRVPAGSAMHRLGVLCSVSAASICLAQSYYLRLRHCMPLLQNALRLLASLPRAAAKPAQRRSTPASASRSQAESVITGVKFTCVALAAKMLEARSGQQKQLRGLLTHLTSSAMAPADTVGIEVRVLQHLDWRLGPYFLPECDDGGDWQ